MTRAAISLISLALPCYAPQSVMHYTPPLPSITDLIYAEAALDGIPAYLCMEIAERESHLDPAARHINSDGTVDRGVFQLNSAWFKMVDAYDPAENVRVGVARLAECWREAGGDWELAKCLYAHPALCGDVE